MVRGIRSWLAAAIVGMTLTLGSASAQVAPQPGSQDIQRGYQAQPSGFSDEGGGRSPAFAYFVAAVCTLVLMVIVCTPSRKLPA